MSPMVLHIYLIFLIKNLLRYMNLLDGGTDDLVTLVCRLIRNTGLLSYITIHKVHWAANVSIFCFLITCVLQVIGLFMAQDDADKLFELFSVLSFCGMGVLKLRSLFEYHQRWRHILIKIAELEKAQSSKETVSPTDYESDSETCVHFSDYVDIYTIKIRRISTILTRIYSFTAIIFIASPFVEYYLCKIRGMECLNYPHISPGWAPLDHFSIFGYIVTVSVEFLASVYCVCVHIAFDVTAIGVMIFVCGQFSLLRNYSSRIGGKGKRCNISKKRDERAHFRIARCHYINVLLINTITDLDDLLKNIIGVYFFLATLTLCSVAVRLKTENMSTTQLMSLTQYMGATLTQLFLFCRYGDAVMNESSMGMGEGPFAAASWCLSPRIKRSLLLLSGGMMTPRRLRAGLFNFLDLPTFIQILRAAYSYFAVLGKKE